MPATRLQSMERGAFLFSSHTYVYTEAIEILYVGDRARLCIPLLLLLFLLLIVSLFLMLPFFHRVWSFFTTSPKPFVFVRVVRCTRLVLACSFSLSHAYVFCSQIEEDLEWIFACLRFHLISMNTYPFSFTCIINITHKYVMYMYCMHKTYVFWKQNQSRMGN